jgi:hypothetical protein
MDPVDPAAARERRAWPHGRHQPARGVRRLRRTTRRGVAGQRQEPGHRARPRRAGGAAAGTKNRSTWPTDRLLPDTTHLERRDAIAMLDRPTSAPDAGAADAIRHPLLPLDRDVRHSQDVMVELAGRLRSPAFVDTSREMGAWRLPSRSRPMPGSLQFTQQVETTATLPGVRSPSRTGCGDESAAFSSCSSEPSRAVMACLCAPAPRPARVDGMPVPGVLASFATRPPPIRPSSPCVGPIPSRNRLVLNYRSRCRKAGSCAMAVLVGMAPATP